MEIYVGSNDLRSGGKYYKVKKYIAHDRFNQPYFANDIAVIRVRGSITFTDKVQRIEYSSEEVPDGAVVQLTGWGALRVCLKYNVILFCEYFFVTLRMSIGWW